MTVAVADAVADAVAVVAVAAVVVVEVEVPWKHQPRQRLQQSLAAEDDAAIAAEVDGAPLLASYWSYSWAGASDPAVTRSEP